MSAWSSATLQYSFHQLTDGFYHAVNPMALNKPEWVDWNADLADLLSLPQEENAQLLAEFSGQTIPQEFRPIAMKYAGHQFGHYNPDLGDGRGLLVAEIKGKDQHFYDLHIKGAGLTPYSRQGDGRAVLRSSIREYLCSEALHHLGIPTSRALGLINSRTPVYREKTETGAICIRVAQSHVRFGHFEHFFYTGQHEQLKQLLDYCIQHYFPEQQHQQKPYLAMFEQVVLSTAQLIAKWNAFGFAHGVLNTDNMSILGQTFDFGPFGFLDAYQPNYICNHSDYQGRYSFANQPNIGLWNLTALAHALSPFIERADLDAALAQYEPELNHEYSQLMRAKTGLNNKQPEDGELFNQLFALMAENKVDYTRFFRQLSMLDLPDQSTQQSKISKNAQQQVLDLFIDRNAAKYWLDKYLTRAEQEPASTEQRCQSMRLANPKYILRNHLAQIAIDKAEDGDYREVKILMELLKNPYKEQPKYDHYANLPPSWAQDLEISCSS
ncbi:YdiU family protein [Vibrio sp. S11_S32]|uniref:protein adenylyltransferase SelO n=1 Tax=Vibrio sp. S11_S32 TaxID=2720225 RepID=UPI00167FE9EB|nr:YdiU family protein [Vibrio sp. S11_S32]MBD1576585.1 YdiU family protein [Vibrio sp. S11_S32]